MVDNKHSRITIEENSTDIRDRYAYRKTIQFLEYSINTGFKLFTAIKERNNSWIIKYASRQTSKQHPSEAK